MFKLLLVHVDLDRVDVGTESVVQHKILRGNFGLKRPVLENLIV